MHAEIIIVEPFALVLDWSGDWDGAVLSSLHLQWSDAPGLDQESPNLSPYARELKAKLTELVAGRPCQWPELPAGSFAAAGLTDFAARVYEELRAQVGRGETITYGALAELAGRPGAARAVGRIMANNPWPMIYPCHRVIGAGRKLTGFGGGDGLMMKDRLLRLEGCDGPWADYPRR